LNYLFEAVYYDIINSRESAWNAFNRRSRKIQWNKFCKRL